MEKKINWKRFWVRSRKVLNIGWKVALVIIGIFAAFTVFEYIGFQYSEFFGRRSHDYDRPLSENIAIHYCSGNAVRIYNIEADKYVTPRLKWVADIPERDSLTVFCDKDDKRGFINVKTGEIVIKGKYEHAWVFSEGLAAVVEPGGKMGFIDKTGKYVIAPELEYISTHDYVFKHNVCCIENKEGNQGLLSRDGTWVILQEYHFINYVADVDMFILTKDEKKGLVRNGTFDWVYPLEYDNIYWIDAPAGDGFILYKDFSEKQVAVDGTVIKSFVIDNTSELKYMTKYNSDSSDEYAISDKIIAFNVSGLWGVMDKHSGRILVPAMYGDVEMLSESIVKCSLEEYGSSDYVLYDLKGNKIQ